MVTYNPSESEEKTLTAEAPPSPITCDAPTPHFPSGCALLLHYDTDNDGNIGDAEVLKASDDLSKGIITKEESDFVATCWSLATPNINRKCLGCYTAPPTPECDELRNLMVHNWGTATECNAILDLNDDGYVNNLDIIITENMTSAECQATIDAFNACEVTHDTVLSIAITDEAGNPITESVVGETVYIVGQLRDIVDNVALQGASIALYRNGVATNKTDITDSSGVYSIPYTVVSGDVPSVRFKTVFGGT